MKNYKTIFFLWLLAYTQASAEIPTIADFLKEQDLISAKISPDGHYLAQLWNKDTARIVTVKDLLQPSQPVISRISDTITRTRAIAWANEQRLLLTVWVPENIPLAEKMSKKKDFDIDDYVAFSRLISTDVNLENGVVLMSDQPRLRHNTNLISATRIAKDSNHVTMEIWTGNLLSLFKVNVFTGASEALTRGNIYTYFYLTDDLGAPLYRFDYLPLSNIIEIYKFSSEDTWTKIERIQLAGIEANLLEEREFVAVDGSDLIYRKKNEETSFFELIRYNSLEKKFETLASLPDQDIIYPIKDYRLNKIIGYTTDGDQYRNHYFDQKKQDKYNKLLAILSDYNFSITSETNDLKKAVLRVTGADNPLSFYLYDFESGQLELINHSHIGLESNKLGSSAVANYLTRDNVKIHSYILFPPNYTPNQTYPLIVLPHGGPQARDRAEYDNFAQFLATRGYLVIKPNFRGSTGYGTEFEQAGYKQWGLRMQDDVDDAVQFMIRKGFADPNKVCIAGISYGGYSALMGAVKKSGFYKCAISINGVTHLRDMISQDKSGVSDAVLEKYWLNRVGNPKTDKTSLDQNSPALQTAKISIPVLIFGSKNDGVVQYEQATTFAKAMLKNKRDIKLITLENSGHSPFTNKKDAEIVYKEVEAFLEKNLKK